MKLLYYNVIKLINYANWSVTCYEIIKIIIMILSMINDAINTIIEDYNES